MLSCDEADVRQTLLDSGIVVESLLEVLKREHSSDHWRMEVLWSLSYALASENSAQVGQCLRFGVLDPIIHFINRNETYAQEVVHEACWCLANALMHGSAQEDLPDIAKLSGLMPALIIALSQPTRTLIDTAIIGTLKLVEYGNTLDTNDSSNPFLGYIHTHAIGIIEEHAQTGSEEAKTILHYFTSDNNGHNF